MPYRSYVRYLNELNYDKREKDKVHTYGKLKPKSYEEGLRRLASDIKLVNALLEHSERIEGTQNWYYNIKTKEYSLKDKLNNDQFLKISSFDWSHMGDIQVLIRIDTPIHKVRKIEAPSPTIAKEVSSKKILNNIMKTTERKLQSGAKSSLYKTMQNDIAPAKYKLLKVKGKKRDFRLSFSN